jgi:hypothetical protein
VPEEGREGALKRRVHLRLDYAWGRDGGLLYFSVGEAF